MPNRTTVITGAAIAALAVSGGAALAAVATADTDLAAAPVTKHEARVAAADAVVSARLLEFGPATEVAAMKAAEAAGPSARAQVREAAAEALAAKYTPSYARAYARTYMKKHYGWGESEYRALNQLWIRESNWDYTATNPTSGAYGIPQSLPANKMASEGKDWRTNPETQIRWGLKYIQQTYGSPSATLAFWNANNWY